MTYSELWLESESGLSTFRVALLAPDEFEIPEGFTIAHTQIDLGRNSMFLNGSKALSPPRRQSMLLLSSIQIETSNSSTSERSVNPDRLVLEKERKEG